MQISSFEIQDLVTEHGEIVEDYTLLKLFEEHSSVPCAAYHEEVK